MTYAKKTKAAIQRQADALPDRMLEEGAARSKDVPSANTQEI